MTVRAPARRVVTAGEPAGAPEQDELRALIEEARRRARRRRRRNGLVLAIAALLLAGLSLVAVRLAGHRAGGGIRAAPGLPTGRVTVPGPYWYMRAVSSMHQWMPAGGTTIDRRGYTHRHGPEVLFDVRLTEETWVGVDGTMRDRVTAAARFASSRGRATWAAWGRPEPDFNRWLGRDAIVTAGHLFPPQLWYPWGEGLGPYGLDLGDSLFSYRRLQSLRGSPSAVLRELTRAEDALVRRQARTASNVGYTTLPGAVGELTDVGGLLASPLPAPARRALLGTAIALPGARVDPHARDALGRAGVGVTAIAGIAMQRLIVEPATGLLLEGPKGVVVAQGPARSAFALPRGITRVSAAGAPPQPPALTISPRLGSPGTVFELTLTTAVADRPPRAPALASVLAGTPGARCFASRAARPLAASAGTPTPGGFRYVYRLRPPAPRAWCPGRYELQVVAVPSARRWRAPPASAGTPTFSAGTGSSVYFEVR